MFKKNPAIITFAILIIAICFFSCDPSGNGSTADDGKVITYLSAEPKTLNPYNRTDANAAILLRRNFQPLCQLDFFDYKLVPVLATALPDVEMMDNGRVNMTLEIREEAKWDNGEPITAQDVIFSLKVMNVPSVDNKALRPYFEYIEDVKVDENNPRKFTLDCKEPYMLMESALTDLFILPSYVYDPDGLLEEYSLTQITQGGEELKEDPKLVQFGDQFNSSKYQREVGIGSGPYHFDRWETNQRVVYKLKDNWWGTQLAQENHWFEAEAKELVYEVINDQTTAVVALRGGKLDAMYRIPPRTFIEELKVSENFNNQFNTYSPTQFLYSYLGINMRDQKFGDVDTRKALRLIMDCEKYSTTVFYGLAERVNSFIHPSKKEFINPDVPIYEQDLDGARELFKKAGWSDSNGNGTIDKTIDGELVEMSFELLYPSSANTSEKGVLMFQEFAKTVGVNVIPRPLEFSQFLERTKAHNFEMYFGIWGSSPLESDPKQIWHTSSYNGGSNYVGFGTPESDKLIDDLRKELDRGKRAEIYKKLQKIIDDECPYIFMDATKNRIAIAKKFGEQKVSGVNPGYYVPGFQAVEAVMN